MAFSGKIRGTALACKKKHSIFIIELLSSPPHNGRVDLIQTSRSCVCGFWGRADIAHSSPDAATSCLLSQQYVMAVPPFLCVCCRWPINNNNAHHRAPQRKIGFNFISSSNCVFCLSLLAVPSNSSARGGTAYHQRPTALPDRRHGAGELHGRPLQAGYPPELVHKRRASRAGLSEAVRADRDGPRRPGDFHAGLGVSREGQALSQG